LYVSQISSAAPQTLARGYELNAIAAAVVGGCSLQGGIGTIPGTVLGVVFLRVVIDGVAKVIKTKAEVYEGLLVGIVVVVAVAFTQLRSGGWQRQRFFSGGLGLTVLAAGILFAGGLFLVEGTPDLELRATITRVALLALLGICMVLAGVLLRRRLDPLRPASILHKRK
jgi:hypothetical protein